MIILYVSINEEFLESLAFDCEDEDIALRKYSDRHNCLDYEKISYSEKNEAYIFIRANEVWKFEIIYEDDYIVIEEAK